MDLNICPRPIDISFNDIQKLLSEAHKTNREKNLIYATEIQSVETLQGKITKDSVCYVALQNQELVGTMTVSFRTLNYWYHTGEVAIIKLVGVLPKLRGKGVASTLLKKCISVAWEKGVKVIVMDSAEKNLSLKALALNHGFNIVDYCVYEGNNFYTTVYALWQSSCPYHSVYRWFKYTLKRIYIRVFFRTGKVSRFKWIEKKKNI